MNDHISRNAQANIQVLIIILNKIIKEEKRDCHASTDTQLRNGFQTVQILFELQFRQLWAEKENKKKQGLNCFEFYKHKFYSIESSVNWGGVPYRNPVLHFHMFMLSSLANQKWHILLSVLKIKIIVQYQLCLMWLQQKFFHKSEWSQSSTATDINSCRCELSKNLMLYKTYILLYLRLKSFSSWACIFSQLLLANPEHTIPNYNLLLISYL